MRKKRSIPKYHKSLPVLLAAIFFASGCSQKNPPEVFVAKIDDTYITVDEFRTSYETAPGNLKIGKDQRQKKRHYLNFMINEKLLAREGYRLGLDQSPYVQAAEQQLQNELMLDELISREVKQRIKVSLDEIKEEINRSKVTFKFRFWVEHDLAKAQAVAEDMRKRGYADVVSDLIRNNPELQNINPKEFETDYLNHLQIPTEVLDAIKDLPFGEISDPVKIEDSYVIFQVLDIRRSAVTENEYIEKVPRFEQIIFYRKYNELVNQYIADMLSPLNIVTKASAFNKLSKAFMEWKKDSLLVAKPFLMAVEQATQATPALYALKQAFDEPFFVYKDGEVSVREFLQLFRSERVNQALSGSSSYRETLDFAVQMTIRDYFLLQRAKQKRLKLSPERQEELQIWRDKWVYQTAYQQLVTEPYVSKEEVVSYLEANKDRYLIDKEKGLQLSARDTLRIAHDARLFKRLAATQALIDSLKQQHRIEINTAVLDTVSVIEFKKNPWATMRVYRGGTNRVAFPTVDPFWGFIQP